MKKKYTIEINLKMNSGEFIVKKIDNLRLAILKLNDGFKIISLSCPHMGGDLNVFRKGKDFDDFYIQCSWNGYKYDLNGDFVENPNISDTLNVREKNQYFDPDLCISDFKENLKLQLIPYKVVNNLLEIEI